MNSLVPIINIDHHITNDKYGDINYIDSKAAATAEIVFELLVKWVLILIMKIAIL